MELKDHILIKHPNIKNINDNLELALLLRNIVHTEIIPGPMSVTTKEEYDLFDIDNAYIMSSTSKEYGHGCSGYASFYLALLKSFNIKARQVDSFPGNKEETYLGSHTSVEFFYNGQYIASDPYFNLSYTYNGDYLGYREARKLLSKGHDVKIKYDFAKKEGRAIISNYLNNFNLNLTGFLSYLSFHKSTPNDTPKYSPIEWDGTIKDENDNIIYRSQDYKFQKQLLLCCS